jgi:hypothetical protein
MTDLSPAARAVHSAFHKAANGQAWTNTAIAAALRAVVAHTQQHRGDGLWVCHANELLAIATELDPSP